MIDGIQRNNHLIYPFIYVRRLWMQTTQENVWVWNVNQYIEITDHRSPWLYICHFFSWLSSSAATTFDSVFATAVRLSNFSVFSRTISIYKIMKKKKVINYHNIDKFFPYNRTKLTRKIHLEPTLAFWTRRPLVSSFIVTEDVETSIPSHNVD